MTDQPIGDGSVESGGDNRRLDVSVIIPVGRVDDDLPLQLDALSRQSYAGRWEIVLSLNSTEAGERAALEHLAATHDGPDRTVRIVDSSDVRSASHARNVGAAAAAGRLLAFCDGDDIADVDWLAEVVAALGEHRAVGGYLEEELLAVPGQEDWRPPATPGGLPTFLGHPFLVSANMGLTRAAFEDVGGFDTSLTRGEDIALSWDLIERGLELGFCREAIIHYRHRRGMWPMMKQHYLYGRGFSQILARRGTPGSATGSTGLRSLRPNSQAVNRKNLPYVLRRGSIAVGRVTGLLEERLRQRRGSE